MRYGHFEPGLRFILFAISVLSKEAAQIVENTFVVVYPASQPAQLISDEFHIIGVIHDMLGCSRRCPRSKLKASQFASLYPLHHYDEGDKWLNGKQ